MKTKIFFTAALLTLFFSLNVFSQILEENFDYPEGDLLTDHGWIANSGGDTNNITVTSPGLSFYNYSLSGFGLSAGLKRTGQDVYKNFPSRTSGSVYVSMMVNVDSVGSTLNGDMFAAMLPSNSLTNYNARLWARAWDGGVAFGVSKTTFDQGSIFFTNTGYPKNTTLFVVVKYTFNIVGTSDDRVDLFVFANNIPAFEPASDVYVFGTDDDVTDLSRIALIQNLSSSSPVLKVDGINVSTGWNSVLPVDLNSFTYSQYNNNITLNWSTSDEINNSRFEIERSKKDAGWINIGFVNGAGNSSSVNNYTFTDSDLIPGKYNYRLKQIDFNGSYVYFNLIEDIYIGVPEKYFLSQNYPNPFNPDTKIKFKIPVSEDVKLMIYDMSGKEIIKLTDRRLEAGNYSIKFDGAGLPSGVYFYKLQTEKFTDVKKMMLIK